MTALGSFPVEAKAEEVAAFRSSIGLDPDDPTVPLTFPMRWLVTQAVRDAVASMVPEPNVVLVHEGQTFAYERPLHIGEPYLLELSAKRETSPDRLLVEGKITAADGPLSGTLETVLRLFVTDESLT